MRESRLSGEQALRFGADRICLWCLCRDRRLPPRESLPRRRARLRGPRDELDAGNRAHSGPPPELLLLPPDGEQRRVRARAYAPGLYRAEVEATGSGLYRASLRLDGQSIRRAYYRNGDREIADPRAVRVAIKEWLAEGYLQRWLQGQALDIPGAADTREAESGHG